MWDASQILHSLKSDAEDCRKPLAEKRTWHLKSKRLWSPLSSKVQISPTAINTLSEKCAVRAKIFNHEIIWLCFDLWFFQWISLMEYKQHLWADSSIQPGSCVNLRHADFCTKASGSRDALICPHPEQDWAAPGLMLQDVPVWAPFHPHLQWAGQR